MLHYHIQDSGPRIYDTIQLTGHFIVVMFHHDHPLTRCRCAVLAIQDISFICGKDILVRRTQKRDILDYDLPAHPQPPGKSCSGKRLFLCLQQLHDLFSSFLSVHMSSFHHRQNALPFTVRGMYISYTILP